MPELTYEKILTDFLETLDKEKFRYFLGCEDMMYPISFTLYYNDEVVIREKRNWRPNEHEKVREELSEFILKLILTGGITQIITMANAIQDCNNKELMIKTAN